MKIASRSEIQRLLVLKDVMALMRDALIAQSRGECDTPLPMHLAVPERRGEIHIKSSYRDGGEHFVVKIASGFPGNVGTGLPTANGLMLLVSAHSGEPVAMLQDAGDLTDARTAAVAAMAAREVGRKDASLGIIGSGVQARWQARAHAEILPLREVWLWGRTPAHVGQCCGDIQAQLRGVDVRVASSPADVARHARLLVTTTAAHSPLLAYEDLQPGTMISAVGSDSPGKQELHPMILQKAALLLVDSLAQCEKLGELQHARAARGSALELGKFCDFRPPFDANGLIVADFTGLGVEDLFIAEDCYRRLERRVEMRQDKRECTG